MGVLREEWRVGEERKREREREVGSLIYVISLRNCLSAATEHPKRNFAAHCLATSSRKTQYGNFKFCPIPNREFVKPTFRRHPSVKFYHYLSVGLEFFLTEFIHRFIGMNH